MSHRRSPGWLTPRAIPGSRLPGPPGGARADRISPARLGRRSPDRPGGNPGSHRAGQGHLDGDLPVRPDESADMLRRASHASGFKVHELAATLVELTKRGPRTCHYHTWGLL